jgi:hypothetical protein
MMTTRTISMMTTSTLGVVNSCSGCCAAEGTTVPDLMMTITIVPVSSVIDHVHHL